MNLIPLTNGGFIRKNLNLHITILLPAKSIPFFGSFFFFFFFSLQIIDKKFLFLFTDKTLFKSAQILFQLLYTNIAVSGFKHPNPNFRLNGLYQLTETNS